MRNLAQGFIDAALEIKGAQMEPTLKMYKSRAYIGAGSISGTGLGSRARESQPIGQAAYYNAGSDQFFNIISEKTGTVKLFDSRAGLYDLSSITRSGAQAGLAYPYVWKQNSNGAIYRYELSGHSLTSGVSMGFSLIAAATLIGISSSWAMLLYIEEGGIKIEALNYSGSCTRHTYPYRIMAPSRVYKESNANDRYELHYSAAVMVGTKIYFYLTAWDRSVLALIYDTANDIWSDPHTAIPQDLTAFYVAGAVVDNNNRIHLSGQFMRTDEQASGDIFNLLAWSDDGLSFSLDRYTLFSILGYRFLPTFDSTAKAMHFIDTSDFINVGLVAFPWAYTDAPSITISAGSIEAFRGRPGESYDVMLVDGSEAILADELVDEGSIAEVILATSDGSHSEVYERCVLASKELTLPSRRVSLSLVNEAVWRMNTITHPMYLELQSKQSVFDNADELDNLYEAEGSHGLPEIFMADFFGGSDTGYVNSEYHPQSHAAGDGNLYRTGDLKEVLGLQDYPLLPLLPFDVKIWGWSRTGLPDTNPNTTDNTPSSAVNDDFVLTMVVDNNGTEATVEIPISEATGYSNPPETWNPTNPVAGSDPVVYSITEGLDENLVTGAKLKEIKVNATSLDPCVNLLERVEIPDMTMYVTAAEASTITKTTGNATLSTGVLVGAPKYPEGHNYAPNDLITVIDDHTFDCPGYTGGDYNSYAGYSGAMYLDSKDTVIDEGTVVQLKVVYKYTLLDILPGSPYGSYRGYLMFWPHDNQGPDPDRPVLPFCANYTAYDLTNEGESVTVTMYGNVNFSWYRSMSAFIVINQTRYAKFRYEILDMSVRIGGAGSWYSVWAATDLPTETTYETDLKYNTKGIPKVLFSQTPSYAFDFDVSASYKITGELSWVGVVGLGDSARDLIMARASQFYIQLCKIRSGVITVLAQAGKNDTWDDFEILLKHRGGTFTVFIRDNSDPAATISWGDPYITYTWKEADGVLAVNELVMHIGAYMHIDAPYVRICSFSAGDSVYLPVMPTSLPKLTSFPTSGNLDVGGNIVAFTSHIGTGNTPRGPFTPRNNGSWSTYTNPSSGLSFGGTMVETTYFDWLASRTKWLGYIVASNQGYAWKIVDTDWRSFITTGGEVVWLKNRNRVYTENAPANEMVSLSDKLWFTGGFAGITLAAGQSLFFGENTLAFLDSSDSIVMRDFKAHSGSEDMVIRDILHSICQIIGVRVQFPGDKILSSQEIGATPLRLI